MLPIIINYAEIHFRYPLIKSKYYQTLPEILTDIPYRLSSRKIPILLIIKDAHLYPIFIKEIQVFIKTRVENLYKKFRANIYNTKSYFSKIFYYELPESIEQNQFIDIDITIDCTVSNRDYVFKNDNYLTLERKSFTTYFANSRFPYPKNWFCGESHFHSNYTDDQVEFGSDIKSTSIMAKSIGLDWFFVTDHSYDLDDKTDNYSENDPNIPKWHLMWKDVEEHDSCDLKIIGGEEISIGNTANQNVHLLHINSKKFIDGKGDSGDSFIHKKPTHSLKDINNLGDENSIFIAAHPFEKVPISQKIILNRGNWKLNDFIISKINYVQAINSDLKNEVYYSVKKWEYLLFHDIKAILIAGNDSHGNFNYMKQIKIPFIKLFISKKQIFGRFMTIFHHNENDPIQGLKNKKIIVGNGPFLSFHLESLTEKHFIGEEIDSGQYKLVYKSESTSEFGEIIKIKLIIGSIQNRKKRLIINPPNNYNFKIKHKSFIRMELLTNKLGFVFTNPIWTK
jgi:hypothetical protein